MQYRHNYVYKSGSGLYAFITNSVNNISIILEDVEIRLSHTGSASYTLYSTVAGLILINWNNVTFRSNSNFTENYSPVIAAYKSNIHMTGQLLFSENTGTMGADNDHYFYSPLLSIKAYMFPAVSTEDCLFADLGIDTSKGYLNENFHILDLTGHLQRYISNILHLKHL